MLLMLGIIASVFAVIWANGEAVKSFGPSNVQQGPNGNIYVIINKGIYILDAGGTSKKHIKLADFGIQDVATWLQVSRNGELMIGDYEEGSIKVCNLNTRQCTKLGGSTGAALQFGNSFQFYMDENRQRIYASDTFGQRVYILDLMGKQLASDNRFIFPNRPFISDDGLLYLADTNHHRIVAIDVSNDRFSKDKWQFNVKNDVGRVDHDFPFIARQDHHGSWWVINAKDSMEGLAKGDLIVYDAKGTPQKRIDLGDDADPSDILVLNDKVLVPDMEKFRITSISPAGKIIGNFGDHEFVSYLDGLYSSHVFYSYIKIAAYVLLGMCVLLALYVNKYASHSQDPGKQDKTQTTSAEVNRLIWIDKNEKAIKAIRMSSVALISLPFLYEYLIFNMDKALDSDSIILSSICMLFLFSMGLLGMYMYNILRQTKIGTDGHNIYFTDKNGKNISIDPGRVKFSTNVIAYKNIAVPFTNGRNKGVFAYDQIQQYILPRLSPSNKMGSWAIQKYLFSNASDLIFGVMLLFLLPCVVMILLRLHETGLLTALLNSAGKLV